MNRSENRKTLAVVVASGGLDSCVVATLVSQKHEIAMLHAQYGQRTSQRELKAFNDLADSLSVVRRLVIQLNHFSQIGGSSLTDNSIRVSEDGVQDNVVPATYVPFRNANLLAAAVSWAEVIGAHKVFVGINQIDSSGYPDCTEVFLSAFNRLVSAGTRPETHIEIEAPLILMTKREIVKLGLDIDAPLSKSWSCYQDTDVACGVCDSCRLRLDGFQKNNIPDPIPYR